ncbi:hypothetical protein [Staphylococcus delphini]|nr:hypothetical protein [Staphylococcus delphini]HEC2154223.1 hypothetical protein [Staphylococcus delphini]
MDLDFAVLSDSLFTIDSLVDIDFDFAVLIDSLVETDCDFTLDSESEMD